LINGLKQTGRKPQETTAVILGAGAAGYAMIQRRVARLAGGPIAVSDPAA
jgi:malic enzyme